MEKRELSTENRELSTENRELSTENKELSTEHMVEDLSINVHVRSSYGEGLDTGCVGGGGCWKEFVNTLREAEGIKGNKQYLVSIGVGWWRLERGGRG